MYCDKSLCTFMSAPGAPGLTAMAVNLSLYSAATGKQIGDVLLFFCVRSS